MRRFDTARPGGRTSTRGVLPILFSGNVLQAVGLQLFVPILPLYLSGRGSSSSVVGLTVAAGVAGYGFAQFPSGWLADRFDRRVVLVVGMAIYSALFLIYLLPIPLLWVPAVRFVHAATGGVYSVAAVAMLANATELGQRGRVFGWWQATQRAGYLVGPLLGGAVASIRLSAAFIGAAALFGASTLVMACLPSDPVDARPAPTGVASLSGVAVFKAILPLIGIAAAGDYVTGSFNSIWSVWLGSRGATPWEIGISFCLFALPSAALSAFLGAIADKRGPKLLIIVSLIGLIVVTPFCAIPASITALTGIAIFVGLFCTPNRPIVFATASREFHGRYLARAQGNLQGGLMSVQFVAALASGALLDVSPTAAFGMLSVVGVMSLLVAVRKPLRVVLRETAEPAARA